MIKRGKAGKKSVVRDVIGDLKKVICESYDKLHKAYNAHINDLENKIKKAHSKFLTTKDKLIQATLSHKELKNSAKLSKLTANAKKNIIKTEETIKKINDELKLLTCDLGELKNKLKHQKDDYKKFISKFKNSNSTKKQHEQIPKKSKKANIKKKNVDEKTILAAIEAERLTEN